MFIIKELLDVTAEISHFKKGLFHEVFTENEKYFLQQIQIGEKTTEKDLSQRIYGESRKYAPYRKMKLSIRNKLQSILHFYQPHPYQLNRFQRAYYKTNKLNSSVAVLLGKQKRKAAIELAKSGLQLSMKYGFTNSTIEFSRILCNHHLRFTGQIKKANKFKEICENHLHYLNMEIKAEMYYSQLMHFYVHKQEIKSYVSQFATTLFNELRPKIGNIKSPKFHISAFLVGITSSLAKNDFDQTKKTALQAISYFESLPFDHKFARIIFINHLTNCHLQLSELEQAEHRLNDTAKLVIKNTTQWYRTMELLFLVKFRLKKYEAAYVIQKATINNKQFSFQLKSLQNRWKLYQIYTNLLKLFNKLDSQSKVRVDSIFYTIPEFSTDKRAMNIPLIIGQLLLFIHEKDYEQIEIRLSALAKYCSRYLKKENNYRSNCFIKMLLEVPIRNFHPGAIKRHTERYYKKLLLVPINEANQPLEIEIIPYEDLWGIILDYLKANRFKRQAKSFRVKTQS